MTEHLLKDSTAHLLLQHLVLLSIKYHLHHSHAMLDVLEGDGIQTLGQIL